MTRAAVAVGLSGIGKTFPGGHVALDDLTLDVHPGERLVIVGPSGGGKSTALRIIAGLDEPTTGQVLIDHRVVTGRPPWQRGVAMAFQRPALVPSRTVLSNLMTGQLRPDAPAARELAGMLGIADVLDRHPHQLSGGQQQRVALGRALARGAPVCLLDEPLGHLDAPLRQQLRRDLVLLHQRFAATIISVTHDPAEAWALGQRVAVLHQGRLQQIGTPDALYRQPSNRFVAGFVGRGPMNFFSGRAHCRENSIQWSTSDWRCVLPWAHVPEGATVLGLRAEDVHVDTASASGPDVSAPVASDRREMRIDRIELQPEGAWVAGTVGAEDRVAEDRVIVGWSSRPAGLKVGQTVFADMNWNQAFLFDAATGRTVCAPVC